jgi:tripartite ATP-independent transporter DctP family solute receptor
MGAIMTTRSRYIPAAMAAMLMLAACGGTTSPSTAAPATAAPATAAPATEAPASEAPVEARKIVLAHSYQDAQPQAACGAKVIADEVAASNTGLTVEIFGQSQLGSDADRIQSVVSGDIDMDIQGASALSALYAPIGAVDGAFVFDDSDHMYRFFTDPASDALKQGFFDATGVRILGAWNTGARQFTANKAIRTPADLEGLKMRFPPSPQFLMNAAAMGANPVEIAYDELYLALQQKIADGQENPLVNIKAINLPEVQDFVSMSSHQLSSNLVVIGKVWDELSAEQQAALEAAVEKAMVEEPKCVVEAEKAILDEFKAGGDIEVIEDVDREAFRTKVEPYLRANFTPEQVAILDAIRSTAK